jgi:hypothetical protein
MNTTTADRLRTLFETGSQTSAGLAEELLSFAKEQPLRCEWRNDACWVQRTENRTQELVEVPIPKSVFRAVLARVAALCNEQTPNGVSPYGGEAVLWDDSQPPCAVRVSFKNTPVEQRLELHPGRCD